MPEIGDKITRGEKTFEYIGYGYWSQDVTEASITDLPLADNASTAVGQLASNANQHEAQSSLEEIIKQLKINNLHLSLMTDEEIDKTEIP